ncbi:MAG: M3 family metallopeptidase [Planctomycetota bacterium]
MHLLRASCRSLLLAVVVVSFAAGSAADTPINEPFWATAPDPVAFNARQEKRLQEAKAQIDQLLAAKAPPSIENTLVPYDDALRLLDMARSECQLIQEVHPDAALRSTAEKTSQVLSAFVTDLSLNRKVYDALSALDISKADPETKYYVTKTLRDFRLAGVDKDDATRERIKKLSDELVEIGQQFSRNIRGDKRTVTVASVAELDGLPADYIARHAPAADGTITLTMDYPDAIPVFSYAKNEDLRRRMYLEYNNRAFPANIDVLDQMRQKRYELSKLVGFTNWADTITADKMVGSAKNAQAFIDRVVAASGERQAREYKQLLARKQLDVPGATAVKMWESNYYSELLRRSNYNFDAQSVRPYFPYASVKQGVLDISAKLFGVEFRRVANASVWHPSVECYELWEGGKLTGRFYLDMHPRDNKYSHAAQFDIRTGVTGKQIPEAALVCNFPGGEAGDAGLMEHSEVTTFFHEFGHLLHTMFAGGQHWVGVGGIRTEQDFVEAPSQMLEEWTRNPAVLATFAKHFETGEPIPAALVKQMNRANDFGKGLQVRRQMVYAGLSLGCYNADPALIDTTTLIATLVKRYQPYPFVDGTHMQCAFGHLDGYSAVYYTYMWSLVIAKDLFSKFDNNDLLATTVATRYRKSVLAPGGSKPAAALVADFLGRPFNEEAWKHWLNSDE